MNLIDRDALIEEIRENGELMIFSNASQRERDEVKREYAINMLLDAPVVDTLRHGHWEGDERCDEYGRGVYLIRCSNCKNKWRELCYANVTTYCPDCGARMDEVIEDESN